MHTGGERIAEYFFCDLRRFCSDERFGTVVARVTGKGATEQAIRVNLTAAKMSETVKHLR